MTTRLCKVRHREAGHDHAMRHEDGCEGGDAAGGDAHFCGLSGGLEVGVCEVYGNRIAEDGTTRQRMNI